MQEIKEGLAVQIEPGIGGRARKDNTFLVVVAFLEAPESVQIFVACVCVCALQCSGLRPERVACSTNGPPKRKEKEERTPLL